MSLRIGWFTAGRGPGSRGMFEHTVAAIAAGNLDAAIEFVFMHRERGEGEGSDAFMDRARSLGIPVANLSSLRFRREHGGDFASHRAEYDSMVHDLIRPYHVDLCVLAGYLLIFGDDLRSAYTFVNLHPALPDGPVGLWQKVIWELIDARAHETGAMTFIINEELDKGPRLAYTRFSLAGPAFAPLWAGIGDATAEQLRTAQGEAHPLFAAIRAAGVRREAPLVTATIAAVAAVAIRIDAPPDTPLDLTAQVEAALASASPE